MSVATTNARNTFACNGVTTLFALDFEFLEASTLTVTKLTISSGSTSTLTLTTDYTVLGGDGETGSISTISAFSASFTLIVDRVEPFLQPTIFTKYGAFPAKVVEKAYDRLVYQIQRLVALSTRTIRQPTGDTVDIAAMPAKTDRLGKLLYFDSTSGNPLATATSASALDAVASSVSVVAAISSAVATTASISSSIVAAASNGTNITTVVGMSATVALLSSISATLLEAANGHFRWDYSSSTTMADPGAGVFRLNAASFSATTRIAYSVSSADPGNPNVGAFLDTVDDSTDTVKGHIILRDLTVSSGVFAIFSISNSLSDGTSWKGISVTHVASSGSPTLADKFVSVFLRTGNKGVDGTVVTVAGTNGISTSGSTSVSVSMNISGVSQTTSPSVNGFLLGSISSVSAGSGLERLLSISSVLALAGGTGRLIAVQAFGASGTYTRTAGAVSAYAIVVGGGGGGGASGDTAEYGGGGGGGGGGTAEEYIAAVSATETVTIGAGGAAASAGGATSFGAHCSATGGAAGAASTGVNAPGAGGAGGAGSGGLFNYEGGDGATGSPAATGSSDGIGGSGGSSSKGGGGRGNPAAAGSAGNNYGGGGGGGTNGNAGGAGAGGLAIVFEFS